jgi:hypothetical protein
MIWLGLAAIGLIAKVSRETKKQTALWLGGALLFYGSLIAWMWMEAGSKAFRGSETQLIGWFIIGLALFFVGESLPVARERSASWALAAQGLGAGAFALGFDVFRPDDYSYVPGAILAVLVLAVGIQAYLRLASGMKKTATMDRAYLAIYVLLITVLVYSATAKIIDRGWALPWAYMSSGGALLFAAGQVWMGWEAVLRKKVTAPWVQAAAINAGQLMMVVAAFFVYREFL